MNDIFDVALRDITSCIIYVFPEVETLIDRFMTRVQEHCSRAAALLNLNLSRHRKSIV